jgi:hypothetical protein
MYDQHATATPPSVRKKTLLLSNLPYGLEDDCDRLLLALALVEHGGVMRGDDPVSPQARRPLLAVDQHKISKRLIG